jgi:hypothetical protein
VDEKIKIKIDHKDVPKGHSEHVSGSGPHEDKRTKRERTRADQLRKALKENENE